MNPPGVRLPNARPALLVQDAAIRHLFFMKNVALNLFRKN